MSSEDGGERRHGQIFAHGLQTAAVDNGSAFGFSITITASYGVLDTVAGPASIGRIFAFALAAAAAFTLVLAAASRGFRRRPGVSPREVIMLGAALDVISVGLGVAAALATATLAPATIAWPLSAFLASVVFIVAESLELTLAARLQRARGDPDAETDSA